MTGRRLLLIGLGVSLLTACTVSISGGVLGALASIGLALLLFSTISVTQTGCVEDPPTRDDAEVDDQGPRDLSIGPCLSDAEIMPCLGAPLMPDVGLPDVSVGPCLSDMGRAPDAGLDLDFAVLPCLEPEPVPDEDGGLDGGLDGMDAAPDARVGPCLEPPPEPDAGPPGKAMRTLDTEQIFTKIAAGLPPDVVARLRRRG